MGLKVKMPITFGIFAIFLVGITSASPVKEPQFHSSLENFSHNIFREIFDSNGQKNIIFSPFSIQTCLAMVRMGAGGQTAIELDQGLSFTGQSAESVADKYHSMLAKYENSNVLQIANKVYVQKGLELQDKYKEVLSQKFFSTAENLDFSQSASAADAINSWVESKTNNAIKDLVKPDMLTNDTRLLLLSAIHFKGGWKKPFDEKNTKEKDFFIVEINSVKVQMMNNRNHAGHGKLHDLDADVVILPYHNSDLSMMIILPESRTGLAALEEKLRNVELQSLRKRVYPFEANLSIPKFKAEFEIKLQDVLEKMAIKEMFINADFKNMLKSSDPLAVDNVIHKAVIEVNEEGTEAAAGTEIDLVYKTLAREFVADHPFYYVIMNEDSVPLFQGTFVGI